MVLSLKSDILGKERVKNYLRENEIGKEMDELQENHEWIAKHGKELERHSGKWIAVDHAAFIAVADNLKELANKPEVKSAKHPLFFLVPKPEEAISIR